MTGIRSKKILADILSRKTRTFLVSASIFVGVLGVIALFTSRNLINQALSNDLKLDELSMIDILVSVREDAALDDETILATLNRQNEAGQAIPALNGIERVEGQAFYPIDWRKPDETDFQGAELRAYWTPLHEVRVEPMRLVEGDFPQSGQNQVAVEQRFADLNGFGIGDRIIFRAIVDGQQTEVTYTITGLVFHPYIFKGLTGELPGPEVGIYAQYADAQALLGFKGFSKIIARYETFDAALANYIGFQDALLSVSPYVPIFPTYENPVENAQVTNAAIFNDILSALALVTMVVSGFLVINVISTIVFEQRRQIGAMKAIGADAGDNFLIYSGIALTYGVLGTVFAIIPGIIAGYMMTLYLGPQLDILIQEFQWSPAAVMIGLVMGLLVPVLAAVLPVLNGVRVRIIDAMTDLGISAEHTAGPITRFLGRLPFPVTVKQGVINVYQKRTRLALTGITLTATAATFMATIATAMILNKELAALFNRLNYQFEVSPNNLQERDVIEPLILSVPEIQKIAPGSIYYIAIEGNYVNFFTRNNLLQVFAFDAKDRVADTTYAAGEGWSKDPTRDGIVVSIPVAEQIGLQVGDQLAFRVGGKRVTREVIGIERNAFDAGYLKWDDLARLAGAVSGAPRPNEYVLLAGLPGRLLPVPAVGMDAALLTFLDSSAGTAETPGIFLSESLAAAQEVSTGDRLILTIAGNTVERPIYAVIPNAALKAAAQQFLPGTAIPDDIILFGFGDLISITGAMTDGDPLPNAYYVTVRDPDADSAAVDDVIEALDSTLLNAGITSRFNNRVAYAENLNRVIATNISIILVAAMLIALVGAIGLLTTLSIAVLERQKEIGVMRSVGASSSAIATQFLIEGQIVALIAWVISIPFSYALGRALFGIFQMQYTPFNYPPEALAIGLVGIIVISAAASVGPALSAARKTVSEILRYQ